MQTEVVTVKKANDKVETKVNVGIELTDIVKQSIGKIIEITNKNNESIREIEKATNEQDIASNEVTNTITSISNKSIKIEELGMLTKGISKNISVVLNEKLADIRNLMKLVTKLNEDIDFFKIIDKSDIKNITKK